MCAFIKCALFLSAAVAVHGLGPQDVIFHLFTPENPSISEPLLPSESSIATSSFQRSRRTIVTIHNFGESAVGNFNAFVIRAHLNVESVNIVAVDWSRVSSSYAFALSNVPAVARVIANFVNILDNSFGYNPENIRIVGLGLGAHAAEVFGKFAQVCAKFNDLAPTSDGLRGCLELEPRLLGEAQLDFPIGCFKSTAGGMEMEPPPAEPEETTEETTAEENNAFDAESFLMNIFHTAEQSVAFVSNLLEFTYKKNETSTIKPVTSTVQEAETSQRRTSKSFKHPNQL